MEDLLPQTPRKNLMLRYLSDVVTVGGLTPFVWPSVIVHGGLGLLACSWPWRATKGRTNRPAFGRCGFAVMIMGDEESTNS